MPSGAKKRKAAKKKKENNHPHIAPNPSSASTHYSHDDVKHKDSDVGEVSSPASQQDHHNHQNVSTERDSEETKNEESVVQIEQEFKIGDESIEKKDGKIKQDESRKSCNEGSSRSSSSDSASSSSDDESHDHGIMNTPAVEDCSPIVDSMKAADHLSETNVLDVEKPMVDDERASFVEKAEVNENEEQNGSCTEGRVGISDPKECDVQEIDDRLTPSYGASNVHIDNGADSEKDSVTQPLLECPVQTTSWKFCCGLCELFTGSAR